VLPQSIWYLGRPGSDFQGERRPCVGHDRGRPPRRGPLYADAYQAPRPAPDLKQSAEDPGAARGGGSLGRGPFPLTLEVAPWSSSPSSQGGLPDINCIRQLFVAQVLLRHAKAARSEVEAGGLDLAPGLPLPDGKRALRRRGRDGGRAEFLVRSISGCRAAIRGPGEAVRRQRQRQLSVGNSPTQESGVALRRPFPRSGI
jgi:hypothetical protein